MFGNIGFGEMIFIAGIALVVMGPEKFPGFAKMVIRTVRDLRGYFEDIKTEAIKELNPIKDEIDKLAKVDPEKYIDALTREEDENPKPEAGTSGFTDAYAASSSATSPYSGDGASLSEGGMPVTPEGHPSESDYHEAMPGEDHAAGYPENQAAEAEAAASSSQGAETSEEPVKNAGDELDRIHEQAPGRLDG